MADIPFKLGLYEAKTIVPIQILDPGTHTFQIGMPAGNSMLSTIYIQDLDVGATVKVNYHDCGPGDGTQAGERVDLAGHPLISTSPISDRRIISRLANKPKCEIIVTGGQATLGVHVAIVADFPNEPAILDGQSVALEADKGAPIVIYDDVAEKWFFWKGEDGVGKVEIVGQVATSAAPLGAVTLYTDIKSTANFEYSYSAPLGTKEIFFQSSTPNAEIKISWTLNGTSGTSHRTIYAGSEYARINLDPSLVWTIYFQSNKANTKIEIETWS
jgi:hypothetical protein